MVELMTFLVRFLLVMLPALLATPAVSAVERFTDLKGTIHITNQACQLQSSQEQERSAGAPTASLQPLPREEATGRPTVFVDAAGTIHLTNAPAQEPEMLQAAEPVPEPFPAHSLTDPPVQPVLFSEANNAANDNPDYRDGGEPAFSATFQLASSRPDNRRVRKFKDRDGIIHITNGGAESGRFLLAGGCAPTQILKTGPRASRPPVVPESDMKGLIRPASLPLPPLPATARAAPAPPAASRGPFSHDVTGVRRYRDSQGVIHLVSSPRPTPEDRGPPGCWRPWPAGLPPGELRVAGSPGIAPLSLRKDRQGTLHLTNDAAAPDLRQKRVKHLKPILAEASFWYGLPVPLIEALIKVESNFAASAVSPKGAMGLMQLMPGTAKDLGVADPFCPRENVLGGCRYLRMLLDACHRSLPLALAAYNAGYRRVADAGFKVPDIKETQAFVTQVLGHYYLAQKKKSQASPHLRL